MRLALEKYFSRKNANGGLRMNYFHTHLFMGQLDGKALAKTSAWKVVYKLLKEFVDVNPHSAAGKLGLADALSATNIGGRGGLARTGISSTRKGLLLTALTCHESSRHRSEVGAIYKIWPVKKHVSAEASQSAAKRPLTLSKQVRDQIAGNFVQRYTARGQFAKNKTWKIQASPQMVEDRWKRAGVSSINNVVGT